MTITYQHFKGGHLLTEYNLACMSIKHKYLLESIFREQGRYLSAHCLAMS